MFYLRAIFTSKEYSFMPIGNIVKDGCIKAVIDYYKSLGDKYYDDFVDMIVFDVVILNTDRHFGNFGFMVDNHTNKICTTASLFDHGLSLLTYARDDDLQDWETYAKTRVPATYSDFTGLAQQLMGDEEREKFCRLINFKLKKHSRYNWKEEHLVALSKLIRYRVGLIL